MKELKPRILVVDDEKFNRAVLVNLLKDENTVILAKNGNQAIDKANSQTPPDLILLDVMMPEMDGYATCRALKKSIVTRDIPVIFVTARQDSDDERIGLEAGAIDYITKPFSPAIVLARVKNQLALEYARKKLAEAHAMLALKNKELKAMATTDALTGLHNRFALDEFMKSELQKAKRYDRSLSVVIMDVDLFKRVNDTCGHLVGDMVLKKLARLLRENIREPDLLGRWGGEEFLFICPETDAPGILILAENLRKCIEEQSFSVAGNITASFGIASYVEGDTAEKLIQRADKGLYRAKDLGRNRVEAM